MTDTGLEIQIKNAAHIVISDNTEPDYFQKNNNSAVWLFLLSILFDILQVQRNTKIALVFIEYKKIQAYNPNQRGCFVSIN